MIGNIESFGEVFQTAAFKAWRDSVSLLEKVPCCPGLYQKLLYEYSVKPASRADIAGRIREHLHEDASCGRLKKEAYDTLRAFANTIGIDGIQDYRTPIMGFAERESTRRVSHVQAATLRRAK